MNIRRTLPLRSFAVFNSNSLTSSVSSMLVPPQALFFAQYTIVGRFSLRESLILIAILGFAVITYLVLENQGIVQGSTTLNVIYIVVAIVVSLLGLLFAFLQWFY